MRRLLALALPLVAGALVALPAGAAFITIQEAEMEADFAGAGIEIDLRFTEPQTLDRPDLLEVASGGEVDSLFEIEPDTPHSVNMFFIDELAYCSNMHDPTLIGCGDIGGHGFMVESNAASVGAGYGALLASHELGHVYGLGHLDVEENLMHPGVTGHPDRTLNEFQRSQIRSSPVLRGSDDGIGIFSDELYTTINPIRVVPEPASGLLLAGGLAGLAFRRPTHAG